MSKEREGRTILTRRTVLRWTAGMAACLPMGVGVIAQWTRSGQAYAQEPDPSAQEVSVETWMAEWMSVEKAISGMLKLSRFREPMYFLTAPISWKPNPGPARYKAVTVPRGFVTDLASIPPIFFPPCVRMGNMPMRLWSMIISTGLRHDHEMRRMTSLRWRWKISRSAR